MSRPHAHPTCPVCGSRLNRRWVDRAPHVSRRWGYVLETITWGRPHKLGDIPILSTRPDDARRWLGGGADALAAMIVTSLAELVRAGWNTAWLRWIAQVLEQWGFMGRVTDHVVANSPPERVVGIARVGAVGVSATTVSQMVTSAPMSAPVVASAPVPPSPPRAPGIVMTDVRPTPIAARVGRITWE